MLDHVRMRGLHEVFVLFEDQLQLAVRHGAVLDELDYAAGHLELG